MAIIEAETIHPDLTITPPPVGFTLTAASLNPQLSVCDTNTFLSTTRGLPAGLVNQCSPHTGDGLNPDWTQPSPLANNHTTTAHQFAPFTFADHNQAPCAVPVVDLASITTETVTEGTAWWVARELDSAPLTGNPSLQSTATDLTPAGGPVTLRRALALLIDHYTTGGLTGFVLHAAPKAVPYFDPTIREVSPGLWRAVGRIPVNVAAGLSGIGPDATGNLDYDGQTYLYATRTLPEWNADSVDPVGLITDDPALARRNTTMATDWRRAALRFDPVNVTAVRVCITDTGDCTDPV